MENDGEVLCNACHNTRLNRSDLNCWKCGGINLDRSKVPTVALSQEAPAFNPPGVDDKVFKDTSGPWGLGFQELKKSYMLGCKPRQTCSRCSRKNTPLKHIHMEPRQNSPTYMKPACKAYCPECLHSRISSYSINKYWILTLQ